MREPLQIRLAGHNRTVRLTPALQRALKRYYPGYSLPSFREFDPDFISTLDHTDSRRPAFPFAVNGDFDGNGAPDVALLLRKGHRTWLLVAFHQTHGGAFRPHRLDQWVEARGEIPRGVYRQFRASRRGKLQTWIYRVPKGWINYLPGDGSIAAMRLPHDGICWDFEWAGDTYFYRDGRYDSVATGD